MKLLKLCFRNFDLIENLTITNLQGTKRIELHLHTRSETGVMAVMSLPVGLPSCQVRPTNSNASGWNQLF